MTSLQQSGLSSNRVRGPPSINIDLLLRTICHDVLWKPVACQSCETPFCLVCMNQWISNNPNKCPNRCETYTQRKCPPFIAKIISYEALDKHEIECGYQSEECSGCQSEILKTEFDNHRSNCASIELTCQDCMLLYKRGEAATKHTDITCLREQFHKLRIESTDNKRIIQEPTRQLNEMRTWKNRMSQVVIKFDDLPSAEKENTLVPNKYKALKWTGITYGHESFWKKNFPKSGYVTSFIPGGSPHIAYFYEEAWISVEDSDKTFSLISFTACAAWNDDMQLTIKGYRNSIDIDTHTITLLFGKPQLILFNWKDISKLTFKPSGGRLHPGAGQSGGSHVVITQLIIDPHN